MQLTPSEDLFLALRRSSDLSEPIKGLRPWTPTLFATKAVFAAAVLANEEAASVKLDFRTKKGLLWSDTR